MNRVRVLRWNRLKKRAAVLGIDVPTLIRLDAVMQREKPQSTDMRREEIIPAATR